jgi:hypothetical protein
MRVIVKFVFIAMLLPAVGCREMPIIGDNQRVLAKVKGVPLYEKELLNTLPKNPIHGDDSVALTEVAVRNWVGEQLKITEAEARFADDMGDIEKKVEAYRQNMLIQKLNQYYVSERLDTVVSEKEIEAYYNDHSAEYKLSNPKVKGRIVRFSEHYRQAQKLRDLLKTTTEDRMKDLQDICAKNGFELKEFSEWTSWSDFVANLPVRQGVASERLMVVGTVQMLRDDDAHYYFWISDEVARGAVAPIEIQRKTIRESLLRKRQADIIGNYEKELIDMALANGDAKIYENRNNKD